MKSDFGKTFSSAVHYAAKPRRMLPFFVLFIPYVIAFLLILDQAGTVIQALAARNFSVFISLLGTVLGLVVLFIAISLIALYLNILAVENSRRYWQGSTKRLLSDERKAVKGTYFNAFAATLAVIIIGFIVGLVPFVGWILGIIVGLMFLAYLPACVTNKTLGIKESMDVFMKNKLETFVFWIVLSLLSSVFVIIAFIPLVITLFIAIGNPISLIMTGGITAVLSAIKSNLLIIGIGGLITAFLYAFVALFDMSARTMYYLQMKKR